MKANKLEKGQVLYIIAIALVALLAFSALAIDGTNVYSQRRKDQSTADSAALAGAGAAAQYLKTRTDYQCTSGNITGAATEAIASARATASADVTLDDTSQPTQFTVAIQCSASNGVPYLDIITTVESSVNTYFLKVITQEPSRISVTSTARVYLNSTYANGNGLVALGSDCTSGGIHALGYGQISVKGAGIFSAACIEATGSSTIFDYGGLIQYTGTNGLQLGYSTLVLNDLNLSDSTTINASLTPQSAQPAALQPEQAPQSLTPMEIPGMKAIDPPSCDGSTYIDLSVGPNGGTATVNPGNYSSLTLKPIGNASIVLKKGAYCFSGPLSIGSGPGSVTIEPESTLYFNSSAGGLKNGGNVSMVLNNTTVYIMNGDYHPMQNTWEANNSKIYIKKGNFTVDGGVTNVYLNTSSVFLNEGNFSLGSGAHFTAVNITVYIYRGSIVMDGAANVTMQAPSCNTAACGVGPAQYGVLFNLDKYNTGSTVGIVAGASANLGGTVYAPASEVTFSGGTTTNAVNLQIIGKKINTSGGGVLSMDTSKSAFYSQGSLTIDLLK
jgi:hypothetical protein